MVVVGPYLHCLRMLHPLVPHKSPVGHDFPGTFPMSVSIVQQGIRELPTCCFGARYYRSRRRPLHRGFPNENTLGYNSRIQAMVHTSLCIPVANLDIRTFPIEAERSTYLACTRSPHASCDLVSSRHKTCLVIVNLLRTQLQL